MTLPTNPDVEATCNAFSPRVLQAPAAFQRLKAKQLSNGADDGMPRAEESAQLSDGPGVSLQQLRAAIPAECMTSSVWWSLFYFVRDVFFLFVTYRYVHPLLTQTLPAPFSLLGHALFWMVAGFFGWCLFVVGHDCGHGSFSRSEALNAVVGHLCHTPLLVPYYGWRQSHFLHHTNHGHVEHDHSWRPLARSFYLQCKADPMSFALRLSPLLLLVFPFYLLMDTSLASGNHFNPFSRLFNGRRARLEAAISAVCVTLFIALSLLYFRPSFWAVCDLYALPYLVFVCWLDGVTYLHHTHPEHVYYRDGAWSYSRGALSTADRTFFGRLIEHLHHDIGTHTVHHLFFTKIPHYQLKRATEAIKPLLGAHYHRDERPILSAFLDTLKRCQFVSDNGKTVKYQCDDEGEQQQQHRVKSD
jgi:omega-3 fatty acid desaturase (delta-15 desaturase)